MVNFHEHKLWQESYVALMNLHEVISDQDSEDRVGKRLLDGAESVASTIADALTRSDKHVGRELIGDAIGTVAVTRTQLAIAWGQGMLPDETFKSLDEKYAQLSESLQSFK